MAGQMIGAPEARTLSKDYFATDDGKLVPPGHSKARRLIGYAGQSVLTHQIEGTKLESDPNADYDDVPEHEPSAEDLAIESQLQGTAPGGAKIGAKSTSAATKKLQAENEELKKQLEAANAALAAKPENDEQKKDPPAS